MPERGDRIARAALHLPHDAEEAQEFRMLARDRPRAFEQRVGAARVAFLDRFARVAKLTYRARVEPRKARVERYRPRREVGGPRK